MATFYNQATLTYSGGVVNSNITTGEIVEVLSITKTAVVDTYTQSSDITYAINILNSGMTPFTGVTLTDDLGGYTFGTLTLVPLTYVDGSVKYFADGVLQPTPTVTSENPLTITGITIPANGEATILYTVTANGFAPLAADGTITNTATINSGAASATATETVTADVAPSLAIVKSVSPDTVAENGQLTYTFAIQNMGNEEATATDNITVTDTFDPILSNIIVTYNGVAWTEPTDYTYDEATGVFQTTVGNITVPAATFTQDPTTGVWTTTPGTATLTVTGTV